MMPKIYYKLLFFILILSSLAFAAPQPNNYSSVIPLLSSNIPNETADNQPDNYAMGFTFSHDGRLFASFFSGKEDLKDFDQHTNGTIKIWNTQTGQLVYQTVVPYYMNAYHGGQYDIAFSPDDKLLMTSSGEKADLILWNYAETNNIKKNCQLGSRGDSENVIANK